MSINTMLNRYASLRIGSVAPDSKGKRVFTHDTFIRFKCRVRPMEVKEQTRNAKTGSMVTHRVYCEAVQSTPPGHSSNLMVNIIKGGNVTGTSTYDYNFMAYVVVPYGTYNLFLKVIDVYDTDLAQRLVVIECEESVDHWIVGGV